MTLHILEAIEAELLKHFLLNSSPQYKDEDSQDLSGAISLFQHAGRIVLRCLLGAFASIL